MRLLDEADGGSRWLQTVKGQCSPLVAWMTRSSGRRLVFTLVRDALPAVVVATVIPMVLFLAALATASLDVAIGVQVTYAYGAGIVQIHRSRRVSGMLMVTIAMATVRLVAMLVSGRSLFYFAAPVVETIGFGLLFVASLATRESLVVRLARDLVPHVAEDLAGRRALCRGLSVIWALTYIGSGSTTMALLLTQPLPVYLAAHQLSGWLWTGSAIAATVGVCRWRARGLFVAALSHASAAPRSTSRDSAVVVALPSPPRPLAPSLPVISTVSLPLTA